MSKTIPEPALSHSTTRYTHHHAKWCEARNLGDYQKARRHLYALRAHLHNLGWLAPEYDRPGYGVYAPCSECGGYPAGIGCYHICPNSVHYYSPEQERADEPWYGADDDRERYAATNAPEQYYED